MILLPFSSQPPTPHPCPQSSVSLHCFISFQSALKFTASPFNEFFTSIFKIPIQPTCFIQSLIFSILHNLFCYFNTQADKAVPSSDSFHPKFLYSKHLQIMNTFCLLAKLKISLLVKKIQKK